MKPQHQYLRKSIQLLFRVLDNELGHYEQKTHSSLMSPHADLAAVLEQIRIVYEEPSSLNISELSQHIQSWLKKEQA